jgi:hypothetical protein
MKTSFSLISMVLVGSAGAALRGTPANDAAAAAAAPITLQEQRGRSLQYPDQACYRAGNSVPCSQIGSCNNAPACAGADQDAITLGKIFCPVNYMVWNNEEPTCAWHYMCCN